MKHHAIITGTGRTGTSFLVHLFTRLGLDTGFSIEQIRSELDPISKAGLESNILDTNAPYIVKSPNISNYIDQLFENPEIEIDLVIIPIRDIEDAVSSRVKVSDENVKSKRSLSRWFTSKKGHSGGMTGTSNPEKQQFILLKWLSNLLVQCSKFNQPMVILHYPTFINDSQYLYNKLKPVLKGVSEQEFGIAHADVARPDWVGKYSGKES